MKSAKRLLPPTSSFYELFRFIWEREISPSDWGINILLHIPKKGDETVWENYRGINLIHIAAKVFRVLLNRFAGAGGRPTRPN